MSERIKMILEDVEGVRGSKADLARRNGVSRKTLHKWVQRFKEGSWEALKDRSRAPLTHPNALAPEIFTAVLELKRRYPFWGAPKLRDKLLHRYGEDTPAESTISAVLKRHGLTRPLERCIGTYIAFTKPALYRSFSLCTAKPKVFRSVYIRANLSHSLADKFSWPPILPSPSSCYSSLTFAFRRALFSHAPSLHLSVANYCNNSF